MAKIEIIYLSITGNNAVHVFRQCLFPGVHNYVKKSCQVKTLFQFQ